MSSVLFCDPHSLFYFLEVVFCSFLFFFTRSELDLFTLTCLCLFSLSLSPVCRRQKRTASHSVQCLVELKSRGRLSRPVLCSLHPGQELRLFCQPCDLPVCLECAATLHRDHRCCPTRDVIDRHGDRIRELVAVRLGPRLERLKDSLQKVHTSLIKCRLMLLVTYSNSTLLLNTQTTFFLKVLKAIHLSRDLL